MFCKSPGVRTILFGSGVLVPSKCVCKIDVPGSVFGIEVLVPGSEFGNSDGAELGLLDWVGVGVDERYSACLLEIIFGVRAIRGDVRLLLAGGVHFPEVFSGCSSTQNFISTRGGSVKEEPAPSLDKVCCMGATCGNPKSGTCDWTMTGACDWTGRSPPGFLGIGSFGSGI